MILGVDNWSFGFAWGMRSEFAPSRPMTCDGLLGKVREYGLGGAQVGLRDVPALGSPEFKAFRKRVSELGLYWEVSAGLVSEEEGVLEALDYAVALECTVVRAFLEGFGIQFEYESLDEYVEGCIRHIENIIPVAEEKGVIVCIENHGGLRLDHFLHVLETVKSHHLRICLDVGNAVLTLEDPIEVVRQLAPRTYTVHLKDWNLIRINDGVLARGCSLGDGVVDLPTVLEILRGDAPDPVGLHLNVETAQEYIPLRTFTSDFWQYHKNVTGREFGSILRLMEKRNADPDVDYRIACMRHASELEILAEEESAIAASIRYAREVLQL